MKRQEGFVLESWNLLAKKWQRTPVKNFRFLPVMNEARTRLLEAAERGAQITPKYRVVNLLSGAVYPVNN